MDAKALSKIIESGHILELDLKQLKNLLKNQSDYDYFRYSLASCCINLRDKKDEKCGEMISKITELLYLDISNKVKFVCGGKTHGYLVHVCFLLLNQEFYKTVIDLSYRLCEVDKNVLTDKDYTITLKLGLKLYEAAINLIITKNVEKKYWISQLLNVSVNLFSCLKDTSIPELTTFIFHHLDKLDYWCVKDIVMFLKNFSLTLKNISNECDIFLIWTYHLKRINLMKLKNLKQEDLSRNIDNILNIVKLCLSDISQSHYRHWTILIKYLLSINKLKENNCINDLQKCISAIFSCSKENKLNLVQFNYYLISIIFNHSLNYWNLMYRESLGVDISVMFIQQIVFHGLLQRIIKYNNLRSSEKCIGGCNGEEKNNLCFNYLVAMNCNTMITIIQNCLKNQAPNGLVLVPVSHNAFQTSFDIIYQMERQKCSKKLQVNAWQCLSAIMFNLVERLSHKPDRTVSWKDLSDSCCLLVESVLKRQWDLCFDMNLFYTIFHQWQFACVKQMLYNDAMYVCVLYLIANPDRRESALKLWVRVKEEDESVDTQKSSIPDVITRYKNRLKELNLNCSELDLKSLLLLELKAYDSVALSKLKPSIENAWEKLKDLEPSWTERACALNKLIPATIGSLSLQQVNLYREECKEIARKLTSAKGDVKERAVNLCHSGQLLYSVFLCSQYEVQELEVCNLKNCEEIIRSLQELNEEKIKHGDFVDLNVTCDVIPMSNRLTVEFENESMSPLDDAYDIWCECVDLLTIDHFDTIDFDSILHSVKLLANTYDLYGDKFNCARTWVIVHKLASLASNTQFQLSGLTKLLDMGMVDEDKLVECEKLAKTLSGENNFEALTHDQRYTVFQYWLARADRELRLRRYDQCLLYLTRCKTNLAKLRGYKFSLCESKLYMLVSALVIRKPELNEKLLAMNLRNIILNSYLCLCCYLKHHNNVTTSQHNEVITACLDNIEWSVEYYAACKLPVFMRLLLELIFPLVYQRNLATRTCQVLLKLADVDLLNRNTDEAAVKLRKIKEILSDSWTVTQQTIELPNNDEEEDHSLSRLSVIDTSVHQQTSPCRRVSPSRYLTVKPTRDAYDDDTEKSPIRAVLREAQASTNYVDHAQRCVCYSCQHLLTQINKLNCVRIDASVLGMSGEFADARKIYQFGYRYAKDLKRRQSVLADKLHRPQFQTRPVGYAIGSFLIQYTAHEVTTSKQHDEQFKRNVSILFGKIQREIDTCEHFGVLQTAHYLQVKLAYDYVMNGSSCSKIRLTRRESPDEVERATRLPTPPRVQERPKHTNAPIKDKFRIKVIPKKEKKIDFETVCQEPEVEEEKPVEKMSTAASLHYKTPKWKDGTARKPTRTHRSVVKVYDESVGRVKKRRSKSLTESPRICFFDDGVKTVVKRKTRRNSRTETKETCAKNDSSYDLFASFEERFEKQLKIYGASSTSGSSSLGSQESIEEKAEEGHRPGRKKVVTPKKTKQRKNGPGKR